MIKEFKEFAIKGSFFDMAVGIVIGAAFSTIVKSLVDDVIMPVVGLLTGGVNFSDLFWVIKSPEQGLDFATLEAAKQAGAITINYGLFINAIITFLIVAFTLFLIIRNINKSQQEAEQTPSEPSDEVKLLSEIRDALKK